MVWKALSWNVLLQAAGLLVFMAAGATLPNVWLKAGIKLVFVACSIFIIFRTFPTYQLKNLLAYSLLAALTSVIVINTIGFAFAPGLVKDEVLFSGHHLYMASKFFCIAFIFYMICAACSLIIRWPVNRWLVKK